MEFCTQYISPIGPLLLASDGSALTGLWMETQNRPDDLVCRDDLPLFAPVKNWLDAYFRGEIPDIGALPLSPAGTPFQQRVWQLLLRIPYGETTTYGAIAREISSNMSAQAVGGAVGRNPIGIIIPCHRCIGAKGQLTGYAGGLDKKVWLLRHEGGNL